ncbi:MAG: protein translocase subunit SecF [Prochloraceae cyanobacterium]|nr:protein translocase subunit SecF [Prochloraceae cyanobacterium]
MKLSVIKYRRAWWSLSAIAVLGSILAMLLCFKNFNAPLRPGLDFIGGTRLQLGLDCSIQGNCDRPIDTAEVSEVLVTKDLATSSSIQVIEKYTLSVRTPTLDAKERNELQQALSEKIGKFDDEKIQIDTVGPSIGRELFASGLLALIVSFFGIIVYLSIRFQFDYAIFAIAALFHDALITAGVFAVLGLVAQVEVNSLFLVSILTIIGFSVNDTVVIYDRIRETTELNPDESPNEIVDDSVNQTLTRSINTTVTTLLPLIAIYIFGGETLKYFALALIIGFTLGSYSSIFIASTLLGWWKEGRQTEPKLAVASGVGEAIADSEAKDTD